MSTRPKVNALGRPRRVKIDLGEESSLPDLPHEIEIGDTRYFLVKGSDGYKLLSGVCPHEFGQVYDDGDDVFTCDVHGYQYDKIDGVCVTRQDLQMHAIRVDRQDGQLSVLIRPD